MFYKKISFAVLIVSLLAGCTTEKTQLPVIPETEEQFPGLNEVEYVLFGTIDRGFSNPGDVYIGADNFLYVADTDNDRIVMMDVGGQVQGISSFIPKPEAITQNDSLQLLVVGKTNKVYKIDLFKYNHRIADAPVEVVFEQTSEPDNQFTGISVYNGFEYYVTGFNAADTSSRRNASFIYQFQGDHVWNGPLPLFPDGTGLFSALIPTSIVSLRERFLDISSQENTPAFIFTQQGFTRLYNNNFKVQHITTDIVEGSTIITPNISLIGRDIYDSSFYYKPEDVALDLSGFVFVVEPGSPDGSIKPAFYRFSLTSGNIVQSFIGDGSNDDDVVFSRPRGIAVLPQSEEQIVYVSDSGNNRILMFILSNQL